MCCPRRLARSRPSAVRVRIRSRSTSARPPRTAIIRRPVLVPVSAHGSANERNCAPASTICFDDSEQVEGRAGKAGRSASLSPHRRERGVSAASTVRAGRAARRSPSRGKSWCNPRRVAAQAARRASARRCCPGPHFRERSAHRAPRRHRRKFDISPYATARRSRRDRAGARY